MDKRNKLINETIDELKKPLEVEEYHGYRSEIFLVISKAFRKYDKLKEDR